jgi:glycine dehydrogenase subunit 2
MEPTETESKGNIDRFIETMIEIAKEAEEDPDLLRQAPQRVKVRRLDEVLAARKPKLKWTAPSLPPSPVGERNKVRGKFQ